MDRADFSDAEWERIGPLLPSERGRWARHAWALRQVEPVYVLFQRRP